MCNLYRLHKGSDAIRQLFARQGTQLSFPEGVPNLELRDVHITDPGPIVRMGETGPEMVVRRWSWPMSNGKPLYNFRSEGRNFPNSRCLVIADGFYEYTAPADPAQKRKDRWLFTPSDGGLLGIAGITRQHPEVGEAYTLLTAEPGPDVAPYPRRQIVLLEPGRWEDWLNPAVPRSEMLQQSAQSYLKVERA